jgi:hypothetical protein
MQNSRKQTTLPNDLEATLSSMKFEQEGRLSVSGVTWNAMSDDAHQIGWECRVELSIIYYGEIVPSERWEVHCAAARGNRFSDDDGPEGVEILRDHVLLAPYRGRAKLAFNGRPENAKVLLADLWLRHQSVTDGWFPFDEFLNPMLPRIGFGLVELLASGGGVLAEGPTQILRDYASVLQEHGLGTSFFAETGPVRQMKGDGEGAPVDLEVLIVGTSFLVGEGFTVRRIIADDGRTG